ncbi:hypothetical protein L1987_31000 [Smallanthus sonchifolius]|uniref:Uncharacterized protein n=1 Tax=Smallanthus sonchifolius TaxID=185202 RepID=A0ACB9I5T9_9ASTR|nr:hypothetical protein L1987_31000 [Smallanthus sonchifolius]
MKIVVLLVVFSCICSSIIAAVSYDDKALIINGRRRILMSGSIHYPRSTPEMWPDLIKKAKDGGLDVIQTYVFWNGHEPSPGKIENEYGPVEWDTGAPGKAYSKWAAQMADGLKTGVPWIMCKQEEAPDPMKKAPTTQKKMTPVGTFKWQSYNEEAPSSEESDTLAMIGLYEQLNVTRDVSDYLWYLAEVDISPNEHFFTNGQFPVLTVMSAGHALHVFINDQLAGTVWGSLKNPKLTFSQNVKLRAGVNKISMLSVSVGLANVGTHFENYNVGILGPITLKGLNEGTRDLTKQQWSYKTTFNAPEGNEPLALDMNGMGKGQIWVNGEGVGRYWPANKAHGNCDKCSYTGIYNENKCNRYCGDPSQRW